MSAVLEKLLQDNPALWRGRDGSQTAAGIRTGFNALDAVLPGGGWPGGALTEILCEQHGIGELRLIMPALAQLGREERRQAWIAPPYIPYPPALIAAGIDLSSTLLLHAEQATDALWAIERMLRSGSCGAVLAWPNTKDFRALRRLQLAAEQGNCWGVLFRAAHVAFDPSPAALRLRLYPLEGGLKVQILKSRGGCRHHSVDLRL